MNLILRAHHIFCIQGFRGKGYNQEFISNMKTIVQNINNGQDTVVKVVNSPDYICLSCPNNVGQSEIRKFEPDKIYEDRGFCENEIYIRNLDNAVLDILNIHANSIYSYKELLYKIKDNLTAQKFENICGECKWYSLGYCKEGLLYNS